MTTIDIIVRLVEALAWPVATVTLVLLVRKELLVRIGTIQRLKLGSLEAEFQDSLEHIDSPQSENNGENNLDTQIPELIAIAQISPKAAIPHAWAQVELSMLEALSKLQGFEDANMGYRISKHIEILRENGFVSADDAQNLHELRNLRNLVSHHNDESESITLETAKAYAVKCAYYAQLFRQLK